MGLPRPTRQAFLWTGRAGWLGRTQTHPIMVPGPVLLLSCPFLALCNAVGCSTPGFPVHHCLLGACSNSCPLSRSCHPTFSSSVVHFSSCPQSFPASGSFQMSQLFSSGGQSTGVSASTSVPPKNTQDRSPLGWTGWISSQSKGLSRVFSNTTVQKHQFFSTQLSLWSNSHICT